MLSTSHNSRPIWDGSWVSDRDSVYTQAPPPRLLGGGDGSLGACLEILLAESSAPSVTPLPGPGPWGAEQREVRMKRRWNLSLSQ